MNETEPLIEVSTHEVRTTDQTIWYSSEEKENKDEVLRRLIVWDDSFDYWENESTGSDESYEGGIIEFYIHQKELYDRIFEHFNLHSNPCSFIASMDKPIEFQLYTKKYVTKWTSPEGTISCYHRWFSNKRLKYPGVDGSIDFNINSKFLFKKFRSYALKFKP